MAAKPSIGPIGWTVGRFRPNGREEPWVEPISPELVLVDPDLAARARALAPPMPWALVAPMAAMAIPGDKPGPKRVPMHAKLFAFGVLAVVLPYLVVLQRHRGDDSLPMQPTAAPAIMATADTPSPTLNTAHTAPLSVFSPPARHRTTLSAGGRG